MKTEPLMVLQCGLWPSWVDLAKVLKFTVCMYNQNIRYRISCPVMDSCSSSEESQPLLLPSVSEESSPSNGCCQLNCQLQRYLCLPSKAAILLICLTVVVSAMIKIFFILYVIATVAIVGEKYIDKTLAVSLSYLLGVLAVILYPVSGFIADVFCGRFRTIVISMCFFIVSFLLLVCASILVLVSPELFPLHWSHLKVVLFVLIIILYGITFGIGVVMYHANFIQFGLDQLMEAPSEHLSLFIHWIFWADSLPSVVIIPLMVALSCHKNYLPVKVMLGCLPFICFVALMFLLVLSVWKRHWFYSEPGQNNPYRVVIKVLTFARKHKYPLQRSAFTYCDDERPSRLDFAKERYGGPFTTEQVEDVKTLFRILVILLVLGPIFVLDMPNSTFGFLLIGVHTAHKNTKHCDTSFFLFESGTLKFIISAVLYPLYMFIMFACIRANIPRIFTRLRTGIILFLFGVSSFVITDLIGHAQNHINANETVQCIFMIRHDEKRIAYHVPTLGLHWTSLIPANLLLGIGPLLVMTAAYEFISSQSPHSMKGLIVGIFLMIKMFFQFMSILAILPFSIKSIWVNEHLKEHPPVTSCGFGYLLFICVFALIGFILFSIAAKRYKHRVRDDRPFDHRFAIDVFSRTIENREKRT